MNNIKFNIILIIFISLTFTKFVNAETSINEMNFYDFKIENIQGEEISLEIYKGKTILLVNVAATVVLQVNTVIYKIYGKNIKKKI